MRRLLLVIVALAGLLVAGPVLAQSASPTEPSPAELKALAALLRDPAIQAWLQAEADRAPAATQAAASEPQGAHQAMVGQLDAMRAFLRTLVAAIPQLPGELGQAWQTLAGDMMQDRGALDVAILLVVFAALGFGLEWLFWWATTGFRAADDRDPSRYGARPSAAVAEVRRTARRRARLRPRQHRRLSAVRVAARCSRRSCSPISWSS